MTKFNRKILITGGAGYIGQNLTNYFIKKKYKVCIVDNLSTSKPINKNLKSKINFFKFDLANKNRTKIFFRKKNFDLIVHLAAFSGVEQFNKNVLKSFNNNILATRNLVNFGFQNKNTKLIFASSAAVYGKVSSEKIREKHSCQPVNYYGLSKLACENIINNSLKNNYIILRYFNVAGSTIDFKISKKINSLMDIIGKKIKQKKYKININGNKHNTKDGTPERDFIHISDLCKIHEKAYKYLIKNKKKITLNCGSGIRHSVLNVINAFEKNINNKFKISYRMTNADETKTICANINLLKNLLKINIEKKKINDLVKDYL